MGFTGFIGFIGLVGFIEEWGLVTPSGWPTSLIVTRRQGQEPAARLCDLHDSCCVCSQSTYNYREAVTGRAVTRVAYLTWR